MKRNRTNLAASVAAGPRGLLLLVALSATGCAQFGYDRLQIGEAQREYQTTLPEERTRRTTLGLCCLHSDLFGGTEAIVVVMTADRRIAAKLRAVHAERHTLLGVETSYALHGELDLDLLRLGRTGPLDLLRVLADELTATEGDAFVRHAQAWVAAGLVRMVQQWPRAGDEGPALPRLTETLERVPRGGTGRITTQPNGTCGLEYSVRLAR